MRSHMKVEWVWSFYEKEYRNKGVCPTYTQLTFIPIYSNKILRALFFVKNVNKLNQALCDGGTPFPHGWFWSGGMAFSSLKKWGERCYPAFPQQNNTG